MMMCVCLCVFVCRVPLVKGKTARESLQEQGLWEQYRSRYPYNPMAKFIQTGAEAMTNDADVSSEQKYPPTHPPPFV